VDFSEMPVFNSVECRQFENLSRTWANLTIL